MKFKITVYPLQRGIRQAGDIALDAAAALRGESGTHITK